MFRFVQINILHIMKKLFTLFILFITYSIVFAQTPSPLPYQQDFTTNDFTFVNGTQNNKWAYGSATGNPGNSIYISNDNGATNTYSGTASTVHAYKDIIIPTGTTNVTFSFEWKAVGEAGFFAFDFFKVWLVPDTYTPVAGTKITAGSGRIQVGGNFSQQSTWQTFLNSSLNVSSFAGTGVNMRIVFEWQNNASVYNNPPAAIDNINVLIPDCLSPTALVASNIGSTTATISWAATTPPPANGYEYYYSTVNTPPLPTATPSGSTATNTANLTVLIPNTTYYYWVRSVCTTANSLWVSGGSFLTGQTPATIPYYQPFTTTNDFVFSNGTQTNKWAYGSATGNAANSIYISNDNGVTNAYTNNTTSTTQAYRDIAIPNNTTLATLSFDWKAVGEGTTTTNYDYFRVWLVKTNYTPTPGTQITPGPDRIQVGGSYNLQSTWQTYFNPTLNLTNFSNQTLRLVFEWRNDGTGGANPPVAIDNINLDIPTCQVPTNLTVTAIGATSATLNWNAATPPPSNGYQYYYSTSSASPSLTTPPSGATLLTTANLIGLTPNTTYYYWVRSKCLGSDVSLWISGGSFTTLQIPANIPYMQDFSGPNDFVIKNGTQTNKWEYGSATGNTGNSIYVSTDAGVTNTYNTGATSVVHAYRDFNVPLGSTTVEFSFDWKNVGENNYDYIRVWITPLTFNPTPGVQINGPAGSNRLQIGGNLNSQSTWQSYQNLSVNIANYAGLGMRLIFEWRNDGIIGTQPPGAIDNVKLVRCDNTPPIVTVSNVLSTSATLTWNQDPGGANYTVRYREIGTGTWLGNFTVASSAPAATNTYTITGLNPLTMYEAEVAAVCNSTNGGYTNVTFDTRCDPTPPGNFQVTNITSNSADVSWNLTPSATYILHYREVGNPMWNPDILLPLGTSTYQLTGLTPYTTYEVEIASFCSGTQNPFSTPKVFTTRPICEMAPIGLTITNLTISSAQVDWNSFVNATYVLMYREVGFNNWVTVNLTTNTYVITGLTEQTQYEVKVANVCGGTLQAFTAPYVFTTPTVIYCDMSSVSSTSEYISNVKVTPNGKPVMNNDSGASNYTDYTANPIKVIELLQGSTNNEISIAKKWNGTTYDEAVTVWIDFNRDGIFSNNERILTAAPSKTTPVTAIFNVPSNAFVSLVDNRFVTMRVALSRDGAPAMCAQFQNGEVEDYKVRISKPFVGNLLDANAAVMVYPNPVKNILNITKVKDGTKYNIYNAIGQLVMKGTIIANKIDVSRLINGVFIIDIDSTTDKAQVKFIKE